MMRKENMWKVAISSALLLTVVATGITLYNTEKEDSPKEEQQNEMLLVENSSDEDLENDDSFESEDVSNNSAIAENYENEIKITEVIDNEEEQVDESTDTSGEVQAALNFTDDSVMVWPVSGELLIDYSMETTTYFATLNQYKCCSGVVLGAEAGTAVQAAANGKVVSIVENEETGMTVTMDLGNGYHAIYGQLKGLRAKVGDTVEQGVILGYVEEPTKYFVEEGANLYFAVKKDGEYVDPMIYLETETE